MPLPMPRASSKLKPSILHIIRNPQLTYPPCHLRKENLLAERTLAVYTSPYIFEHICISCSSGFAPGRLHSTVVHYVCYGITLITYRRLAAFH